MLKDPRGTLDDVERARRGLVHDDSAKERRDESSRPDSSQGASTQTVAASRRPAWLAPVAGAVLLIAVVGGAYAVISGGGDDDPDRPDSARGAEVGADGNGDGDGGADVDADAGPAAATTFTGPSQFNIDAPVAVGTATVTVTCDAGCTVTVDDVTGHSDNLRMWVVAALGHDYTESGTTFTFEGTPITSCAQIEDNPFANPSLWSAELTRTDDQVTITAVLPEFQGRPPGGGSCGVSRTELTYTGTPS